jgi:hypothetical protein
MALKPFLQFQIHVGLPQKSLIFKVILPPAVGQTRLRSLKAEVDQDSLSLSPPGSSSWINAVRWKVILTCTPETEEGKSAVAPRL